MKKVFICIGKVVMTAVLLPVVIFLGIEWLADLHTPHQEVTNSGKSLGVFP
jgi:hypothetical protein